MNNINLQRFKDNLSKIGCLKVGADPYFQRHSFVKKALLTLCLTADHFQRFLIGDPIEIFVENFLEHRIRVVDRTKQSHA